MTTATTTISPSSSAPHLESPEEYLFNLVSNSSGLDQIRKHLTNQPNLDMGNAFVKRAFLKAIELKNIQVIGLLLDHGFDITQDNELGIKAIHHASQANSLHMVERLLEKNLDLLNIKDSNGRSPLMTATGNGHLGIVEYLLDKRAKPDEVDLHENTALMVASANGFLDIVQALRGAGANMNLQNKHGYSALIIGCKYGHLNIVQDLLNARADMDLKDKLGSAALHMAIYTAFEKKSCIAVALLLIQNGANVNLQEVNGDTPLHVAIREIFDKDDRENVIQTLIENGANLNLPNKHHSTPFHMLTTANFSLNLFETHVIPNAEIDQADGSGNTALHLCVQKQAPLLALNEPRLDLAKLLLRSNINYLAFNNSRQTALDLAKTHPEWNKKLIELLEKARQQVALKTKLASKRG